jgi:putative FmdB family regulatory protein
MPFYEYECAACGHYHEAMQKMSDAPLKACPTCGKPRLVRLISAPQFRLKGAGWYETDFKSAADAKRNLADSAEPTAKADDAKDDKVRVKPSKLAAGARKAASAVKRAPKKRASKVAKPVAKKAAKKKAVKQAAKKAAKKAAVKPAAGKKAPAKKKSAARKAARPK